MEAQSRAACPYYNEGVSRAPLGGGLTLVAGILLVVVITLLRGPAGQDE